MKQYIGDQAEQNEQGARSKFMTPPEWQDHKVKSEDWRFETELWMKFTTIKENKRGFAVYRNLPYEKVVHKEVRLAIQNEEIQIEDKEAVKQIFAVLYKIFKEDDLTSVYDIWKKNKNFEKERLIL